MRGQHWGGVSKCNEEDAVAPLCRVGSLHKAYLTPEGLKVGRQHGDVEGGASHSEKHNAILCLWPTLKPLQWIMDEEWRDT